MQKLLKTKIYVYKMAEINDPVCICKINDQLSISISKIIPKVNYVSYLDANDVLKFILICPNIRVVEEPKQIFNLSISQNNIDANI